MSATERVLVAIAVVAVDALLFAVPLTGLVAAWVVLARPRWFGRAVERLYADRGGPSDQEPCSS